MSAVTTDLSYRARLLSLQQQTLLRGPQRKQAAEGGAQSLPAPVNHAPVREASLEPSKAVEESRKGILHIVA